MKKLLASAVFGLMFTQSVFAYWENDRRSQLSENLDWHDRRFSVYNDKIQNGYYSNNYSYYGSNRSYSPSVMYKPVGSKGRTPASASYVNRAPIYSGSHHEPSYSYNYQFYNNNQGTGEVVDEAFNEPQPVKKYKYKGYRYYYGY